MDNQIEEVEEILIETLDTLVTTYKGTGLYADDDVRIDIAMKVVKILEGLNNLEMIYGMKFEFDMDMLDEEGESEDE
jgi:hypothetical protein